MNHHRWLFLCALIALSLHAQARDERTAAVLPPVPVEQGQPALFSWGDLDGDGRLDLAAVLDGGRLQILRNGGDGQFEDVTGACGLADVRNATFTLWADYDGDTRVDLFLGAREGASCLYRNEQGVFVDMTAASGLVCEGAVQAAHWLDHDGDGRLDLHVITSEKSVLFHGLEGGFFESTLLPLPAGAANAPGPSGVLLDANRVDAAGLEGSSAPEPSREKGDLRAGGSIRGSVSVDGVNVPGASVALGAPPSVGTVTPLMPFPLACADSIKNQVNPGTCLQASTTPTLGRLYPISANLFVAVGGNVGIGTTSPSARLDVAGTARMTGTLTLNPGGDQALDVSTGSIYKGGALFIHSKGGTANTALGREALASVTSGNNNTASGYRALFSNTTGNHNTASGFRTLYLNTTGHRNTASGERALTSNTTGAYNTAIGYLALASNTTGLANTASGYRALLSNTTGSNNTACGMHALLSSTTGIDNTASGYRALISNTTGSRNTANGFGALDSNTTGGANTATGYRALFSNTTGSSNTASGFRSLYSNTSGILNTASGYRALFSNTTGHRNTASGYRALFSNTTGRYNVAHGARSLDANTTGSYNTACGFLALASNTGGLSNTATGYRALLSNTTGYGNIADGVLALRSNTTGALNSAIGYKALYSNTTGHTNTACGRGALRNNTSGSYNIGLGTYGGSSLTTGSGNIAIHNAGVAGEGNTIRLGSDVQTRTFIAGIRGRTTGIANAIPVLIDSAGQLGTVSSSRRFKEEIADMGDATERLLALRPVVFRYKPEVQSGERPLEYGLIAEEVAQIFPDLVVYDDEGLPFTVKYHLLSSMLLNELKKLHEQFESQVAEQEREFYELEELRNEVARLRTLETRLVALEEER